ncbi:MAG: response regulator transcription factor [Planctomycetota bacterium]
MVRKRLVLADDHQIFLEGLERLLQADFDVVGTASSGPDLVALARDQGPDVIITDYSMPGLTGIEALDALRAEGNPAKVIILTMHEDAEYATEAIEHGVDGYVLKRAASAELLSAIQEALGGGCWVSPALAAEIIRGSRERPEAPPREEKPGENLSDRQRRILALLVKGKIAKEIAAELGISRKTVEYHKYKMMDQLGTRSTAELIQFAVRNGLDQ